MSAATARAAAILQSTTCECRVSTGRHHMTRAIVELLDERGRVSWTEACARARRSALDGGYLRAADTAYLRHTEPRERWRRHALWTQGYLAEGDPRRGERFTREATMVRTRLELGGSEPIFHLID